MPDAIAHQVPEFYKQVIHAWFNLRSISGKASAKNTFIWNNKDIKIDKKAVFFKLWYKKVVLCISDLMDDKNKFLSYNCCKKKFNIDCHILQYIGLIDAIPSFWHTLEERLGIKWLSIDKCTSQKIYLKHIELFEKEASCI